jgi:hypothetical protein
MRAREFIVEKKNGKIPRRFHLASAGIHTFHDPAGKASSDYIQYRLGLAVAGADGENPIENMDQVSWHGKMKTAHPYTKVEDEMLKQAYDFIGADYYDLNGGDLHSGEPEQVNTVSPVAQWNKKL